MRSRFITAGAVLFSLLMSAASVTALAQAAQAAKKPITDDEYVAIMKQVQPTFMSLGRNNTAMDHAAAIADAKKLEGWFTDVEAYWEARKADDPAVNLAKTALKAAQDIQKASVAMNMGDIATDQMALQGTCMGCHMLHRDRQADGTSKFK